MKLRYTIGRMGIAVSMMMFSIAPVFADDESDLKDLQNQQSQVQDEQTITEEQLRTAQDKVNAVVAAVEELDQQICEVEQTIQKLNEAIEENLALLETTKEELTAAEEEETYWYSALKQRIQIMYESGDVSYLEVLLQAESMSDLFSKIEYSKELAAKDQEIMNHLTACRQEIADKKAAIEEEEASLEANREAEKTEKEQLQLVKEQKDAELDSLRSDAAALQLYQQQLDELETQIQAQITETEAAIAARKAEEQAAREAAAKEAAAKEAAAKAAAENQSKTDESSQSQSEPTAAESKPDTTDDEEYDTEPEQPVVSASGLSWPVSGYSYISSPFGYRNSPLTGIPELHRGIDIPAPSGTPIHAAAAGTVITACYNSSYGNYVMISHGNGLVTLYAHAVSLNVSVGQTVSAGDVVSFVGTTGDSNGNHCHFEVRMNGTLQDPLNYVSP